MRFKSKRRYCSNLATKFNTLGKALLKKTIFLKEKMGILGANSFMQCFPIIMAISLI